MFGPDSYSINATPRRLSKVTPLQHPNVVTVEEPFPKFWGTDVTSLPADFKAFLKRCPDQYCELHDGRKLCYFTDGDPHGVPVLAFHGGTEGKFKFAQKDPLPGIYLISIDRPHYGGSCPIPFDYSFDNASEDIGRLIDHLNLESFVVTGHSVGTSWAMQLAASPLAPRIRGVILWSTMIDPCHPATKGKYRKDQGFMPSIMDPVGGCCGCILSSAFGGILPKFQSYNFKDMVERESKLSSPQWAAFQQDPFWVAAVVYSARSFYDKKSIAGDAHRTLISKWDYDVATIKCPIWVFHGDKDYDMATKPVSAEWVKALCPQTQVEMIPNCGHTLSVGPNEETRARFVKAVAEMPEPTGGPGLSQRG